MIDVKGDLDLAVLLLLIIVRAWSGHQVYGVMAEASSVAVLLCGARVLVRSAIRLQLWFLADGRAGEVEMFCCWLVVLE